MKYELSWASWLEYAKIRLSVELLIGRRAGGRVLSLFTKQLGALAWQFITSRAGVVTFVSGLWYAVVTNFLIPTPDLIRWVNRDDSLEDRLRLVFESQDFAQLQNSLAAEKRKNKNLEEEVQFRTSRQNILEDEIKNKDKKISDLVLENQAFRAGNRIDNIEIAFKNSYFNYPLELRVVNGIFNSVVFLYKAGGECDISVFYLNRSGTISWLRKNLQKNQSVRVESIRDFVILSKGVSVNNGPCYVDIKAD